MDRKQLRRSWFLGIATAGVFSAKAQGASHSARVSIQARDGLCIEEAVEGRKQSQNRFLTIFYTAGR